jgi:hypothetical protein
MKISVSEAISRIHPNSEFVIYNNDLDRLTFIKPDNLTVTQEQVDQAIIELEEIRLVETQAKAQAKTAAQAKLAALGLTVEDLQALGL